MLTATAAYLFLWTGGSALVLLWCRRLEPPVGVVVGLGWGLGIVLAGLLEALGGFERLPVVGLSALVLGLLIVASLRSRLWPTPSPWDLVLPSLIAVTTVGLWADAASGSVGGMPPTTGS